MGLSEFIQANQEAILAEFEAYVRSHAPPGVELTRAEARDHASQVLDEISAEMRRRSDQQGDAPAEKHGSARRASGFDIEHVLGEYQMLRASIIRMWLGSRPPLGTAGVDDLVRFNEAVDQAVNSSVAQFEAERTRAGGRKSGSSPGAPPATRQLKRPNAGKRKLRK